VSSQYSRRQVQVYGVVSWVAAVILVYIGLKNEPPPALAELVPVEGVVDSLVQERYGLEIRLQGDTRDFGVANKTGYAQPLFVALERSRGERVTLWVDVDHPGGPLFASPKNYYDVFSVAIGGRVVMGRDKAAAGWQADTRIALWLGVFFLLSGSCLFVCARQLPQ
jgi:hypothetical protein